MHNLDHSPLLQSPGRPFALLREVCKTILAQKKIDVGSKIGELKIWKSFIVLQVAFLKDQTEGCKNLLGQVVVAIKYCVVASNICGPSVWNLFHVTILARRILRGGCKIFVNVVQPCRPKPSISAISLLRLTNSRNVNWDGSSRHVSQ